jgi:hypothetical protein
LDIFSNRIYITNGSIRKGTEIDVTLYKRDNDDISMETDTLIFLDDSFYSGTTRNRIHKKLVNSYDKRIAKTYVIYDGSLQKE